MDGKGPRPPPPNPAMPYRDDCWSEGATSALIDAWGDRFVELNRGNLRQKDWQEVADAVNSRPNGSFRTPRTDSQCKNRVDTLKKKYKAEKLRISNPTDSRWPLYPRLDFLIGPSSIPVAKKPSPSPPLALPLPAHRKNSAIPAARLVEDDLFYRTAAAAAAAAAAEEDGSASSASSGGGRSGSERPAKRQRGEGDGIGELALAVVRFAEIYEKVEVEKQRQVLEMEKRRMEFAKGLEFQRMQVYVDSLVQFEKLRRAKRADADGYL